MIMKPQGLIIFIFLAFAGCTPKSPSTHTIEGVKKFVVGYNEPVRGVWLTNVASDALYSKENIQNAVKYCDELGLNTIFVVTWNKAMTTYRSQLMKDLTGVELDPELDPQQTGRDPLREVIDEAKKYGIKVFAWFEFGFSSSYQEDGGILLTLKPEWSSLNVRGKLTTKNGFEWMNALDPEVQDFMLSLVLEVVNNYEVDGIQGDDRLPAMPSEGGYNPEVMEAYAMDNFGTLPPEYSKDFNWIQWRSEKLNEFMKQLYKEVKRTDPACIISMSPSIFPWSKEEYLQDWPTWVNFGYVDMVCPQVYRKDSLSFSRTLAANVEYILPEKRHLIYPGLLIRVDSVQPSGELLEFMIQENRRHGLEGEVYFFYEGLSQYEEMFKRIYKP